MMIEVAEWFVCYSVHGRFYKVGPFETADVAAAHANDIRGYEGVTGCFWSTMPPF